MQAEEPHPLCMFLAGIDAVATSALALPRYMDLHVRVFFIEHGHEQVLDGAIDFLLRSPSWRLNATEKNLSHDILTEFLIGLRNTTATTRTYSPGSLLCATLALCAHNLDFTDKPAEGKRQRATQ